MRRCLCCRTRFDGSGWTCPSCGYTPTETRGVATFAPALAEGDGSDAEYRFERLARAQSWHFWFVRRAELLSWAIKAYFPAARTFFEAGCGTGSVVARLSEAFPAMRITAGDTRLAGLCYTKQQAPEVEIVQCDALHLPFDAEFDVAGAFDVIEHVDDDIATLTSIREIVRPGGGLLVTVPQHPWLWSEVDRFSHHRRRYTRAELRAKLLSAGFQVDHMTSFAALGVPILWISRRIPRTFDPDRELTISPLANAVLSRLLAVEQVTIRAGVSLPFGTSLLAIARRPA